MPVAATIAIDGPAGAGKTVVGQKVANRLGYLFLDTGAMYRAVAYLAFCRGVSIHDEQALAALAREAAIDIRPDGAADGRPYTVLAAGEDVTWAIRRPEVDATVSIVAAWPAVRREMVRAQARVAARGGCVLAGRDIGTVVLPNADLKIFLTADADERVERRRRELAARGREVDAATLRAELAERDRLDSQRKDSPLRQAADAVLLDTTHLSVDAVAARIVALARERTAHSDDDQP